MQEIYIAKITSLWLNQYITNIEELIVIVSECTKYDARYYFINYKQHLETLQHRAAFI